MNTQIYRRHGARARQINTRLDAIVGAVLIPVLVIVALTARPSGFGDFALGVMAALIFFNVVRSWSHLRVSKQGDRRRHQRRADDRRTP